MKKCVILIIAAVCVAALVVILRPIITLELAKRWTIRKLSSQSQALSRVPSTIPTNIIQMELSAPMSTVELSGCTIALPSVQFRQDSIRRNLFTNDDLVIAFYAAVDPQAFGPLQRQLNCSNVLDLVSSAYRTTVDGISEQRSMAELRRYVALIQCKATFAPMGSDHLWLSFDRGDFKGYVAGDLAKDPKVAVEIYIKEKDQFLSAAIRRKNERCEMADVYRILSIVRVKVL